MSLFLPPPSWWAPLIPSSSQQMSSRSYARMEEHSEAESLVRQHGLEPECKLLEALGCPAGEEIVRDAEEWPADIIVMGTHGRRGIRRIVMGSDAELVLRTSPVPVLLVRSPKPG